MAVICPEHGLLFVMAPRHGCTAVAEVLRAGAGRAGHPGSGRCGRRAGNLRGHGNRWLEGVDFVMRYERLQEDFDAALRRAGVNRRLTIPRVNVTPGREHDYRVYYTERAKRKVEAGHQSELRRFGYTVD